MFKVHFLRNTSSQNTSTHSELEILTGSFLGQDIMLYIKKIKEDFSYIHRGFKVGFLGPSQYLNPLRLSQAHVNSLGVFDRLLGPASFGGKRPALVLMVA